jgi:vesicle coat complex subunit
VELESLDDIIEKMRSPSDKLREFAIRSLANLTKDIGSDFRVHALHPEFLKALIERLTDSSNDVALNALFAIERFIKIFL